jgi:nucleoside-diphosphate-sugar epimerase
MRIAVTGASGHIGLNLVKRLIDDGHFVRVLIHRNNKVLKNLGIEFFSGNLIEAESIVGFCDNIQVVFHLAAVISIGPDSDENVILTNVLGTMNLLTNAKNAGVGKFIYFSSIHAYDHMPYDIQMDETNNVVTHSDMPYELSKALSENLVISQQCINFDVVVLSPTSVIGPEDHGPSLMGKFIQNTYRNRISFLVPGGYDWVDVRDVINAAVNAIEHGKGGQRYILSGVWMSVKEFADILARLKGKKGILIVIPLWLAKIGVPIVKFYSRLIGSKPLFTIDSLSILQSCNKNISSHKACKELDFSTIPLRETLNDTIEWFGKKQN